MDFGFTDEEEKLRAEVREFLRKELTPEAIAETRANGGNYGGPEGRKVIRKLGARGWLVPTWPRKYGGLESSHMVEYVIRTELVYAGLPWVFVGANMAGPTILEYASEELTDEFLPKIAKGEIELTLGYTEPQAGSDLAAIEIRAEDKGDYFLLNGQKVFNTSAHIADYHWLGARTAPGAGHKGISLMLVDLKSPGITIRPMVTMAGWKTNEIFYDDVQVPKRNMVGEKNHGFYYIMSALDLERMFPVDSYLRLFEELVEYAKETKRNGKPLSKDPVIRQRLAQVAIELEVSRLLYYQLADILDKGKIPNYQSSMEKVFATETCQRVANTGMQIMGLYGQLHEDSKRSLLEGKVEHYYRWPVVETIYAGTSEIQRNIIALRG